MIPEEMLREVYEELRRLASVRLAAEAPGQTISATALVHEAWLKLADASIEWQDRSHFFRTAATAMRRILVERARRRLSQKRDGGARVEFSDFPAPLPDDKLLTLDESLRQLQETKPDHAKLVELRYYVGLTGDEAAQALGVSSATADRMWRYAKAWLQIEMNRE